MKKQCVDDPEKLNWEKFWHERLETKEDKNKDWDKAAPNFHKVSKKDDYNELLLSKLILTPNDTVLDLGCGEGSITLPLAKKVQKITGIDSSFKMLELLNQRAQKQNINNVYTIQEPIENISYKKLGDYDIVLASRSLNGIIPIHKTLKTINKIANKYVFITLFGPNNWKIQNEFLKYLGKQPNEFPGYNYIFNILFNMGIYANIEKLNIKNYRQYNSIEEAINNNKFRPELLNRQEKEKLKEYLKKILKKDPKTGKLYNSQDKADWILIWWEKNKKRL